MSDSISSAGKTADGREVWVVVSKGEARRLTTKRSSIRVMDEAVVIYGATLRRLAKCAQTGVGQISGACRE